MDTEDVLDANTALSSTNWSSWPKTACFNSLTSFIASMTIEAFDNAPMSATPLIRASIASTGSFSLPALSIRPRESLIDDAARSTWPGTES